MRRVAVVAGVASAVVIGGVLGTVVARGSTPEPTPFRTLGVEARQGECVQWAFLDYVSDEAGHETPEAAVAALAGADIGPGLARAIAEASALKTETLSQSEVILARWEDDQKVAAYQVMDLGENRWAVTRMEYSGPCSLG